MRFGWARRESLWPTDAVRGSGRLHLRPLRRSDYREYVSLERESEAWLGPWTPLPSSDRYSRRRFFQQVRWARDQARLGNYHRFGIFLNSGRRIAGSASVSSIQYGAAWGCSVGYWVGLPFAGQGLMPEALCLLLDFIFLDLSLHRTQFSIMPGNRSSRRVVEKLGLRCEGVARDYLCIAGRWEDHEIYAILADEYRERRGELFSRFVMPVEATSEAVQ